MVDERWKKEVEELRKEKEKFVENSKVFSIARLIKVMLFNGSKTVNVSVLFDDKKTLTLNNSTQQITNVNIDKLHSFLSEATFNCTQIKEGKNQKNFDVSL